MDKKELLLVPGIAFGNHLEVAVMDYPRGREDGTTRRRCKVTLEYGRTDVDQLKAQGHDLLESAMAYYRDYIYQLVKVNISSDWTCVGGLEETMAIVQEHLKKYY